jgi:hypothetical protein
MRLIWTGALVLTAVSSVYAADLSQMDRQIAKEPAYRSKPRYCLLVFGPWAKTRVWLVLDGDVLYADRNGNGDLTEPDKKIAATRDEYGGRVFHIGSVQEGPLVHQDLTVTASSIPGDTIASLKELKKKNALAECYSITVRYEDRATPIPAPSVSKRIEMEASGDEEQGWLQFADSPKEASIVNFGGPLKLRETPEPAFSKWLAGQTAGVRAYVGTPGLGSGTFATIAYNLIPSTVRPLLEVTIPAAEGSPPIHLRQELKYRC